MSMKMLARTFVCLLPMSSLKARLLRLLGYSVAPGATMAPNLVWNVQHLVLGEGSVIGVGNVFRALRSVELGAHARVSQWNWVTGGRDFVESETSGRLVMGEHSAVTSRHYLDATAGITIGKFAGLGGVRSTVLTHGVDWATAQQTSGPVSLGDYCLLNSNVVVLAGTVVHERVVVGAHSLVANTLKSDGLYLSATARRQRPDTSPEISDPAAPPTQVTITSS